MTRSQMQDYRAARSRLEVIETELAKLESRICVQSAVTPPYSKHSTTMCGLPPDDRVRALLAEQAALRERTAAAERFVASFPDERTRFMLREKFFHGRSNLWIAMRLGYRDEGTVRKKIKKIFQLSDFSDFDVL